MRRALGMMQGSIAAGLVAVAGCFALQRPDSAHAEIPPSPPGWQLAFGDDFEGPAGSLPSSERWRFSTGTRYLNPDGPPNWGTGEVTHYTDDPANVSLDGAGRLRITPLRDEEDTWTSARIETNEQQFKPPPGGVMRIEGMLQLPNPPQGGQLGYWPAFWILGSPYRGNHQNWPSVGEVDIMENVNRVGTIWGVLHCSTCNEPNGIAATTPCATCPGNFHRYRFEWDLSGPVGEMRWYLNDLQYHTVSESQLPPSTWAEITGHAGYFILLNVAMGGGFPNGVAQMQTPTPSTVPGHPMLADYVAVWYWDPEAQNQPPVIEAITATPQIGDAPLEVAFTVEASDPDGDDLSYGWDFGDGWTSDEQNPTHTYAEPGTYEAVLTVSDGEAEAGDSVTIEVTEAGPGGAPAIALEARPPIRRVGAKKKRTSYRVRARNIGDAPTGALRLCAKGPRKRVKVIGASCRQLAGIAPTRSLQRPFKLRIKRTARGKTTRIRFIARGPSFENRKAAVRLRVRR